MLTARERKTHEEREWETRMVQYFIRLISVRQNFLACANAPKKDFKGDETGKRRKDIKTGM